MLGLPSGNVTFLLTDIEESARLWEQDAQAMASLLSSYSTLLRQTIAAHSGVLVYEIGDTLCAAFTTAAAATLAALVGQRLLRAQTWPAHVTVRVRMVLHTEVAEAHDGRYTGMPTSRAARLLTVARGGQIVLSSATRELVAAHLPDDATLYDLGWQHLPDSNRLEHLFQLVTADLPVLPLLTNANNPYLTNLPPQITTLIGREREAIEVCTLLRHSAVRLMTFTGPGGTGKTRFALHVATALHDHFPDGVYFVALAPISDPALVAATIAQTLAVQEVSNQNLLERLKTFLRDKALLLLLDNFEQVLSAAPLVAELLVAAPLLKILVTSRAVLHLSGEYEFVVPPLQLPDTRNLPPLEQLTQYEAVRLFIERARTVNPGFVVTSENAPAVAEICHRLDGLPLAIELAAVRSKLFSPHALLGRLGSRLELLKGGSQDRPARQRTLRSAIDWSYSLLEAAEPVVFARLAVFVGGCSIEAAEAVIAGEAGAASNPIPVAVLDLLASLVDKSLLRCTDGPGGEPRFVMLETIREYALERLNERGELHALQQRHAHYYLSLVQAAEPELVGSWQVAWLERLEADIDNLRAALHWGAEQGDNELTAQIASCLWLFWLRRGHLSEGWRWHKTILERRAGLSPALQARLLRGAGRLADYLGDHSTATDLLTESLALARQVNDHDLASQALNNLGTLATSRNDYHYAQQLHEESYLLHQKLGNQRGMAISLNNLGIAFAYQHQKARAQELITQSLGLWRQVGDIWGVAAALNNLGVLAMERGNYTAARAYHEESLAIRHSLGDRWGIGNSFHNMSDLALNLGNIAEATALCAESLALNRELGSKEYVAECLSTWGRLALWQDDIAGADSAFREMLALSQDLGDKRLIAEALYGLSEVAACQHEHEQALHLLNESTALRQEMNEQGSLAYALESYARLALAQQQPYQAMRFSGAAQALRTAIDEPLPPLERPRYEQLLDTLRAQLDTDTLARAWEQGQALPLETLIAELGGAAAALATPLPPLHTASPPETYPAGLTSREVEVLRLVAQGLTNAQVAERLVLSRLTVNSHLRSIYGKLGVTTRSAATRFALEQGLA